MSDLQYNLQFERLCDILNLGEIVSVPQKVLGGLLNRMYVVETTKGKYAIKALNPQIMLRPTAMTNYINSERIANIAANYVPALPAKIINGTFIHEIDNQFYLLFDWVDGKTLKFNEINANHCEKMGVILANIHMTDFSELNIVNDWSEKEHLTDWCFYLSKGQENNTPWANLLSKNIDHIRDLNCQANNSASLLSSDMVISHRDLDPKNVMWNQGSPTIIDWEASGYINPLQELIETAIYWSENNSGYVEKDKFISFIDGYRKTYGKKKANWRIVLTSGFVGKLGWLEYNLKRSLWIECTDEEEQQVGTAQVTGTINAILNHAEIILRLEKWLNDIEMKDLIV